MADTYTQVGWQDGAGPNTYPGLPNMDTALYDVFQNSAKVVISISALKSIPVSSLPNGATRYVIGYYGVSDSEGNLYRYNSSSSAADNGGSVIAPNSGSGRWELQYIYDYVTPGMFGGVGDGATLAHSQVQAAATYASFALKTLKIPEEKAYRVGSTITVSSDVGGKGKLISNFTDLPVLEVNGDDHKIRNITVDCEYEVWARGILLNNTNRTLIENVTVRRGYHAHIHIGSNAVDTTVRNCTIRGTGFGVLYDDHPLQYNSSGSHTLTVEGCSFTGETGSGYGGDGIEINAPARGFTNLTIRNNNFRNIWATTGGIGLGIGMAGVTDVLISGNNVRATYHDGIHVENGIMASAFSSGTTYSLGFHVTSGGKIYRASATVTSGGSAPTHTSGTVGNWQYLLTGSPVGASRNVHVSNNYVADAAILSGENAHGILVLGSMATVTNNHVIRSRLAGIYLLAGQSYNETAISDRGILVHGNTVDKCGTHGIANEGYIAAHITSNTIRDCSQEAVNSGSGITIYFAPWVPSQTPDDNVIANNQIWGPNHYAHLRIWYGSGVIERDNDFHTDAATSTVAIEATAGTVFRGEPIASVQDVNANGFTVALGTYKTKIYPLTAGAARTGTILAAGLFAGQKITLINRSTANSIAFATSGISRVADGASTTLSPNRAYEFTWDSTTSLWYRTGS